jgi:formylglycine-generating enzyme required for sulfatase activity
MGYPKKVAVMPTGIHRLQFLLVLAAAMSFSCGSAEGSGDQGIDAVDLPADSVYDVMETLPADAPGDFMIDTPVDFLTEVPGDSSTDMFVDLPIDAADVPPLVDAPSDTAADLPLDVPPEVVQCTADCGAMVPVAAASFAMGCGAGAAAAACGTDEKPSHAVSVPAFEIDQNEVTAGLWARCHVDGACSLPNASSSLCTYGLAGMDQHPINCISWEQASSFCRWAGKRLCTEAEWELAAVGSDGRTYPWGEETPTCDLAVMDPNDGSGVGCGTANVFPVGSKPAGNSQSGAADMAGNVWEWVQDFYHEDYTGAPVDGSAWLVPEAEYRVARGAAFSDKAEWMRASARKKFGLQLDGYYLGTRCCRSF